MIAGNPESLVIEAQHVLFRAQLDELRAMAIETFREQFSIDRFGVRHCMRCGAPVLVGPKADIKLKECGEHEA